MTVNQVVLAMLQATASISSSSSSSSTSVILRSSTSTSTSTSISTPITTSTPTSTSTPSSTSTSIVVLPSPVSSSVSTPISSSVVTPSTSSSVVSSPISSPVPSSVSSPVTTSVPHTSTSVAAPVTHSSAAPVATSPAPESGLSSKTGLSLDTGDSDSIKAAARSVAASLLSSYTGGNPGTAAGQVGLFPFPEPWYWWESGAIWTGMIDYWKYVGDDQYEQTTLNAVNAQVGPAFDFVMPEQVGNEGNDDQAFWAFNALAGYENGFPALGGSTPSYLTIGANTFNDMVERWNADASYCGGGLRWHYTPGQNGYLYKNSVSNGGFFNIAARMAVNAKNSTYADWGEKIYDWSTKIGFIGSDGAVYDGANLPDCTPVVDLQWTYNTGLYMHGAAALYDYYQNTVGDSETAQTWLSRAQTHLSYAQRTFFTPYPNATNIMFEAQCETVLTCDIDEYSFKAYLARFMAKSVQHAPSLKGTVQPLLEASAVGAAEGCESVSSAGAASSCGTKWYTGGLSGPTGLGQSLAVLEVIQSLLMLG